MRKAPIHLQDLRRKIYVQAKAEPSKRFWGLYVHVCKEETLRAAYQLAKSNNGAPGSDGVSFETIEQGGVDEFLAQIRNELLDRTYRPMRNRKVEIPKDNGKVRVLSIPSIRDRVVQGALKLILEPIFEADFQPGSFGYRPKKSAAQALRLVSQALAGKKTRVIDLDLKSYFDNVRHHILLSKLAKRIDDDDVMKLLAMIMKASGEKGVPQGGVISPLLSNIYLNEVDKMLETAKEKTRHDGYAVLEYVRFADDIVVLIHSFREYGWLVGAVHKRLREEFAKLGVEVNEEKTRTVFVDSGDSFAFLGFDWRKVKARSGKMRITLMPQTKKRTALLRRLKPIFRNHRSQPVDRIVRKINPIVAGWVNYFRVGESWRTFRFVRSWTEKKIRRHLMRCQKRKGFGWKKWSSEWIFGELGLFNDYQTRRLSP
jgi:RNA-directed DNA polymerase